MSSAYRPRTLIRQTKYITRHTQKLKKKHERKTTILKELLLITYTTYPIQKPSIINIDYTTKYKTILTTDYHNTNPQGSVIQTHYKQQTKTKKLKKTQYLSNHTNTKTNINGALPTSPILNYNKEHRIKHTYKDHIQVYINKTKPMKPKHKPQSPQILILIQSTTKPSSHNYTPTNKHLPQYTKLSHNDTKPNQGNKDTTTPIPKAISNTNQLKQARPTINEAQYIDITIHTNKNTRLENKQDTRIPINKKHKKYQITTSTTYSIQNPHMAIVYHSKKYKDLPTEYYQNTNPQHPTKKITRQTTN